METQSPGKLPPRLWIIAACGAVALHVGCIALAVAHLRADEADDELGANAIEIGMTLVSPHIEPSDLPAGPDAQPSIASPAVVEQRAVVKDSELPKAVPTETEDPDRIVKPEATEKPEEEPKIRSSGHALGGVGSGGDATAMPSSELTQEAPW